MSNYTIEDLEVLLVSEQLNDALNTLAPFDYDVADINIFEYFRDIVRSVSKSIESAETHDIIKRLIYCQKKLYELTGDSSSFCSISFLIHSSELAYRRADLYQYCKIGPYNERYVYEYAAKHDLMQDIKDKIKTEADFDLIRSSKFRFMKDLFHIDDTYMTELKSKLYKFNSKKVIEVYKELTDGEKNIFKFWFENTIGGSKHALYYIVEFHKVGILTSTEFPFNPWSIQYHHDLIPYIYMHLSEFVDEVLYTINHFEIDKRRFEVHIQNNYIVENELNVLKELPCSFIREHKDEIEKRNINFYFNHVHPCCIKNLK